MQVNDRVQATVYGTLKTGTVKEVGKSGQVVFVRLDGEKGRTWFHRESVKLIEGVKS